jgi:CDP-diacylglycerol--glycerol-3-phosphate 3-phosphatidyltransferase
MNLPNSITMSRIACIPLLIWILSPAFPWQGHGAPGLRGGEQEIIACIVFILASITDGLDGYLARRRHQITTMGMLLDPLADKLLITTGYIILVGYNPNIVKPWIAVLVIGREFLVSGLPVSPPQPRLPSKSQRDQQTQSRHPDRFVVAPSWPTASFWVGFLPGGAFHRQRPL